MAGDHTDEALSRLAHALNDLYRLSGSSRFHAQTVRATGLGVSRTGLRFLSLVADAGPLSVSRLGAALDLSQPTASRVLQQLEAAGLVTRRASSSDGRVTQYAVTLRGRRALTTVHAFHVRQLAEALAAVEPDRRRALAGCLDELVAHLRQAPVPSAVRTA